MHAGLILPLEAVDDEPLFGGKAQGLGAAIRAGLPVPPGVAIAAPLVERAAAGDPDALAMVRESHHLPAERWAVRSSGAGEDAAGASFAGQHATVLNVTRGSLADAIRAVWSSARTASALAYRARKGLSPDPRMGVVIQTLIDAVAAGVLFTRHPVTGADERLVEAAWGLGEIVVSGEVVPDRYRIAADGRLLECVPGDKDVKIAYGDAGGTITVAVPAELRQRRCLDDRHLRRLIALTDACRRHWGPHLDIEWAVDGADRVHLLQCRPITTLGPSFT